MTLLCCFKDKSVRTSTIPPLSRNKENNRLPNNSPLGVSANNNFAEHAAALRTIQKNTDISENKRYFSNELQLTDEQYMILYNSAAAKNVAIGLLDRFAFREQADPEKLKNFDARLKKDIGIKTAYLDRLLQASWLTDKSPPLILQSYQFIENTKEFLSDPERLKKLTHQSEARYFLNTSNFHYREAVKFNKTCQAIEYLSIDTDAEDLKLFLRDISCYYAASGIIRNQLPIVKHRLSEAKKIGKLDKNFLMLIESTIHNVEVGLRNMDHPKRKAILEAVAPKKRPVDPTYAASVLGPNPVVEAKTDQELKTIFKQLKAIPVELG